MEKHQPVVVTDGGPWAEHDVVCPVCGVESAVIDLNTGIFQPGWKCQKAGWLTLRTRRSLGRVRWLQKRQYPPAPRSE